MVTRKDTAMTITRSPDQEQAVRDAIRAGKVTSADEFSARAIASLPSGDETPSVNGLLAEVQPLMPPSPSGKLPCLLVITWLYSRYPVFVPLSGVAGLKWRPSR